MLKTHFYWRILPPSLSLTHISIYTEGEERGQDRRVSAKDKKEEFIKTALISWPNYRLNENLVESIVGCGRIDQPPQLRLMYFCFVSLFPSVFLILLFFSFLLSLTCTLSFSVSRACMHRMSEREMREDCISIHPSHHFLFVGLAGF